MSSIPSEYRDLFEKRSFLSLGTLTPDGFPHVTPVWVSYDEAADHILVNTARGRRKEKNLRQNERVGGCILDPEDPYRYLGFQGEVRELTTEGAVDHIDELAQKYIGEAEYPYLDDEEGERVLVRIEPTRVFG
ncbi:PPOX class F420-dependent oxidoreductase [Halobacterium bonnevillei]|uniref:TIGR03618 family F420-dependent PPOX class oxidoreductase n=1 Tax=Halobacterium bonnevillei TaxID=2692200 RepID=A0A6B0SUW1_9EURY|nr:PPOX class F420-dependent oxidoreductase [Halobacterium bonnevillei]MXR21329.1 TIGR03618 family F420-dependent PPOX class oxidoreductase [Halobacterium bonnevillei]